MNVSYAVPLRNAWSRMLRMLFRPFRIESWFVLGFAAFLSEYRGWGSGGMSSSTHDHTRVVPVELLRRAIEFFSHPLAVILIVWLVLAALTAFVLLTWLSSRAKFIFLDNVVRERAGIVEPWRRFKRAGNSLFRWRLGFGIVCLLAIGTMLLPFVASVVAIVRADSFDPAQLLVLLPLAGMFLPFGLLAAYVSLFLNGFVVPIMYRHDLGATAAWGRFLTLFRRAPGSFVLYGLFMLFLSIGVGCAVFAVGMGTCCVGFVLLGTPYIGSVLTLPLEVTARALGAEFLAQFGEEFNVLAPPAPASAPTSPPASGPGA